MQVTDNYHATSNRADIARLAQHLVNFAHVELFFRDHSTRIVFEQNRAIANQVDNCL